ncbi:LacI family DNA-binding transcriptional regulator [uncultured Demequina sp.]|uniref:LacI family DNA-binding transcriptional regulator n=1 Tax=uncultured Demequina sp. TaxID=693499 RepID=UPI0025E2E1DB|nr:LacI family DNA-binding transcriptional regulator [uncultured Demequina sp.]
MTTRSGPATIAEVAAHAGVSPATVSRVMNGRFVGEPSVAERVRASARALDYHPNHLARSLALGRTGAVGLVVPDLANPAFQEVLSGLAKSAAEDGYRILVTDSAEHPEDEPELATEIRRRCDAVVLCAPRMRHDDLVTLAPTLDPLVLVNRPDVTVAAPSLSIDYGAGIAELARYMYESGHRRFAFLAGPEMSVSNALRLASLDRFASDHPDTTMVRIPSGVGIENGLAAADAVARADVTAALAYNDLVAVGLINGLAEHGIRVPEDISVAGFDDIPYARYMSPPLTTVAVPHTDLGVEAWDRMQTLLNSRRPAGQVVLTPRLEVRGSTDRLI